MLGTLTIGRQSWKKGVPRPIDAKGETDAAVRIDVKSTVGRGRTAMIVGKQQTAVSKIDEAAPTAAKRRRPGRKASLRTGVNQCARGYESPASPARRRVTLATVPSSVRRNNISRLSCGRTKRSGSVVGFKSKGGYW